MGDSRLEIKDIRVKEIFNSMEYGEITENVELAKSWFQKNNTLVASKGGLSELPSFIPNKQNGEKLATIEYCAPNNRIEINTDINTRVFNKLADELKNNEELICQIEILSRGILAKDTKKELNLLIECLQYNSGLIAIENVEWTFPIYADDSIAVFGYHLVTKNSNELNYCIHLSMLPIATLIKELACKVGLLVSFNLVNYDNVCMHKTPMVIFNSADLDSACESVCHAAWDHQGSLKWSVNKVFVQEDVFDIFVNKLKNKLKKIKMGHANDKMADVAFPTLIHNYVEQMNNYIKDASKLGIEVFKAMDNDNVQPTLFIGGQVHGNNAITHNSNLPGLTILAFRNTNEAIALTHNTNQSLAASIWTENIGLANEVATKLKVGTVWINSHGIFDATISFASSLHNDAYMILGGREQRYNCAWVTKEFPEFVKAQIAWMNKSVSTRAKILRKFADHIEENKLVLCEKLNTKSSVIDEYISRIYKCTTEHHANYTSIQGKYCITSLREPMGCIKMHIDDDSDAMNIPFILMQGNVVIINNNIKAVLITELVKFMPTLIHINPQRFTTNLSKTVSIDDVTSIKNIWSPIGESIL